MQQHGARAGRPLYLDPFRLAASAETEVLDETLARQIGRAAAHLPQLPRTSRVDGNAGTDGIAITARADQLEGDPVLRTAGVVQQRGRLTIIAQQHVHLPIVIVVEQAQTAPVFDEIRPLDMRDVRERAVAVIAEQTLVLAAIEAVLAEVDQPPLGLISASTDAFEHVNSDIVE